MSCKPRRVELIQALIPLGLKAVHELLQQEVTALAGARYQRPGGVPGYARRGSQSGSVYLSDQKVAVPVLRVRTVRRGQEVPLTTCQSLRQPRCLGLALCRCKFLLRFEDRQDSVEQADYHQRQNEDDDRQQHPLFREEAGRVAFSEAA